MKVLITGAASGIGRASAAALLYTDGTVIGKPESSYSFTGESSSKESENSYSLKKKED